MCICVRACACACACACVRACFVSGACVCAGVMCVCAGESGEWCTGARAAARACVLGLGLVRVRALVRARARVRVLVRVCSAAQCGACVCACAYVSAHACVRVLGIRQLWRSALALGFFLARLRLRAIGFGAVTRAGSAVLSRPSSQRLGCGEGWRATSTPHTLGGAKGSAETSLPAVARAARPALRAGRARERFASPAGGKLVGWRRRGVCRMRVQVDAHA